MKTKSKNSGRDWVDPDDAPTLTDADLARGTWRIGGKVVPREKAQAAVAARRRGRPAGATKESTTIRLDHEVLEAFRASGDGWQTRMNAALKDWLKTHSPSQAI